MCVSNDRVRGAKQIPRVSRRHIDRYRALFWYESIKSLRIACHFMCVRTARGSILIMGIAIYSGFRWKGSLCWEWRNCTKFTMNLMLPMHKMNSEHFRILFTQRKVNNNVDRCQCPCKFAIPFTAWHLPLLRLSISILPSCNRMPFT